MILGKHNSHKKSSKLRVPRISLLYQATQVLVDMKGLSILEDSTIAGKEHVEDGIDIILSVMKLV